jgi:hypothetical protein
LCRQLGIDLLDHTIDILDLRDDEQLGLVCSSIVAILLRAQALFLLQAYTLFL